MIWSVHQAEALILGAIQPLDQELDQELLELEAIAGRILATSVSSPLDFPHWDNSAMDGYAVRFTDVQACSSENPMVLEIIEEIPAGSVPQKFVEPGQAARIFTGAMMPAGADTVVMQEVTKREGSQVWINESPKPQAFVRHRGAFYQAGTPLLSPGIRLGAPEIAVLASAQCCQVPVYRRPRIAIFSTGDELGMPDSPLKPGQIVDSNQYALAALVTQAGGIPILRGIVPDEREATKAAIASALESADLVISSGGVSVGDHDYIEPVLESLGAQIQVRAIAIKPGKPLTFATVEAPSRPKFYFGLPGNPVSSLVCFWRFVQPAIAKLSGLRSGGQVPFVQGRSRSELRADGKRETYLWGQYHLVNGELEFTLSSGSHSSGNFINLAGTTALAVLPVGCTEIAPGESVLLLIVNARTDVG